MNNKIPVLLLISVVNAQRQLFCRCNCGANYTVVPVDTCNDCTKRFCVKNADKSCQNVELAQISTSCFTRESTMHQVIIYMFLAITAGLLFYAAALNRRRRQQG